MPFLKQSAIDANKRQIDALFPVPESAAPPAPALKPGFRFNIDGHSLVVAAALNATESDVDLFRRGDVELRLFGDAPLVFGLALRFKAAAAVTPWYRTSYSWLNAPDYRKARPLGVRDARLMPEVSRRLDVSLVAPQTFEVIATRHFLLNPNFALALDRRVEDGLHATNKPGWFANLQNVLDRTTIPEQPEPWAPAVGTVTDVSRPPS